MYKKITLTILTLFMVVHSAEISSKNLKITDILNPRSSTFSPNLSLSNQHSAKNNSKRSLFLLTPLSRAQDDSKETGQKTKRYGPQLWKSKLSSLYTSKENSVGRKLNNPDINIYARSSKEYADSAVSKMESETHDKNKTPLRILRDNLSTEDVMANLGGFRDKTKRCNTGRYVCYCKEEDCFHKSFRKSPLRTQASFRKDKPGKIGRQKFPIRENASPIFTTNILQHGLPNLYGENLPDSRIPTLMSSFPIKQRNEINHIPRVPFGNNIPQNDASYMLGNEKGFVNVGVPFTLLKSDPNFVIANNAQNLYPRNFYQNLQNYPYSSIIGRNKIVQQPAPIISINPINTESDMKTINEFEPSKTKEIAEKNEEGENYVGASANSKTNHSVIDENNSTNHTGLLVNTQQNAVSKDTTETIGRNGAKGILPKLTTTISIDEICSMIDRKTESNPQLVSSSETTERNLGEGLSSYNLITTPSILYERAKTDLDSLYSAPTATTNTAETPSEPFTDLFETTTSPMEDYLEISTNTNSDKELKSNYLNQNIEKSKTNTSKKIMHQSEAKDFTEIRNSDKTDDHFKLTTLSLSDYNRINGNPYPSIIHGEKFINIEECMKLFGHNLCVLSTTSPQLFVKAITTEQTYDPDNYNVQQPGKDKTFNSVEDGRILTKNLEGQISDEVIENAPKELLGKSKNFNINNVKELEIKSTTTEEIQYSTTPSNFDNDEEFSKNIDLGKFTQKETITDYDSNNNFDENATQNTIKWTDTIYSRKDIPQEQPSNGQYSDQQSNDVKISSIKIDSVEETTHRQEYTTTNQIDYNKESTYLKSSQPNVNSFEEMKESFTYRNHDNSVYPEVITYPSQSFDASSTSKNYVYETVTLPGQIRETESVISLLENTSPTNELAKESLTKWQLDENNNYNKSNPQYNIENLKTVIESSTKKLPFCDNTLLLNSIKKVINDFALGTSLANTANLDENVLQMQGRSLSPEILKVPNLKDILLLPRVEDTIVEKVKNVLTDVMDIPNRDLTNNRSHHVIRNTLRNILETVPAYHWKLPPMTVEEHQFRNGQWMTNLVTLSPVPHNIMSTRLGILRNSIKELLDSPVIGSQAAQRTVQNIIIQSAKNALNNYGKDKESGEKIDDSVIDDTLQSMLETLKKSNTENINKPVLQEASTTLNESEGIYEKENNIENSMLNRTNNVYIKTTNNNETNCDQKIKALKNDINTVNNYQHLNTLQSHGEYKDAYITQETSTITNKDIYEMKKDINQTIVEMTNKPIESETTPTIEESQENIYIKIYYKDDGNDFQVSTTSEHMGLVLGTINPYKETVAIVNITQETATLPSKDEDIYERKDNVEYTTLDTTKKKYKHGDEKTEVGTPSETAVIYHKAISQNAVNLSTVSAQSNLTKTDRLYAENLASSVTNEGIHEIEEHIKDQVLGGTDNADNVQNEEIDTKEPRENTTISYKSNSSENDLDVSTVSGDLNILKTTKSCNENIIIPCISQKTLTATESVDIHEVGKSFEYPVTNTVKNIHEQDEEGIKHDEALKTAYDKAISQDNFHVSQATPLPNLTEPEKLHEIERTNIFLKKTLISSTTTESSYKRKGDITDLMLKINGTNVENQEETGNNAMTCKQSILPPNPVINEEHSNIYVPQQQTLTSEVTTEQFYMTKKIPDNKKKDRTKDIDKQYNKAKEQQEKIYNKITLLDRNIGESTTSEYPNLSTNRPFEIERNDTTNSVQEINIQETTKKSLDYISLEDSNKILRTTPETISSTKLFHTNEKIKNMVDSDETFSESAKQNNIVSKAKFLSIDELSDKDIIIPESNTMLPIDDTTDSYNTNYPNEYLEITTNLSNEQQQTIDSKTEVSSKYNKMNPVMIDARYNIKQPTINYYSSNDRILEYIKNHRVENQNNEATTSGAFSNSMQRTSVNYTPVSYNAIPREITETKDIEEMNKDPSISTGDLNLSTGLEYINHEPRIAFSSTENILGAGQQKSTNYVTESITKTNEVTTEIQRIYAKTTYLPTRPLANDSSKINMNVLNCETINCANNNNKNNNPNSIQGSNNVILSNDNFSLQLLPSSNNSQDILELQKSQLYYINDGVKLPLEIRKLKGGSYALLISKNICEQLLNRKCPCCVPLQGHVVRSLRNHHQEDVHKDERDDYAINQSLLNTLIMPKVTNTSLEEKMDANYSLKDRKKRNLINKDSTIISMPVIDFVKKYNLSYIFDDNEVLWNEIVTDDEIQNYDESLMKLIKGSQCNQSKLNLVDNLEMKKNELSNGQNVNNNENNNKSRNLMHTRRKKYTSETKFGTLTNNSGLLKSHTEIKQSETKQLKSHKPENKNYNMYDNPIMISANQIATNLKRLNVFEEEGKIQNGKVISEKSLYSGQDVHHTNAHHAILEKVMTSDKNKERQYEEIKLIKSSTNTNNEQMNNIPKIKVFEKRNEKPYRYQRNVNGATNKKMEVVKNMLHWFKHVLLNLNES